MRVREIMRLESVGVVSKTKPNRAALLGINYVWHKLKEKEREKHMRRDVWQLERERESLRNE